MHILYWVSGELNYSEIDLNDGPIIFCIADRFKMIGTRLTKTRPMATYKSTLSLIELCKIDMIISTTSIISY